LSNPVNRQTDIPTDAGENITSLADENISYIRLLAQPDRILWQVKEDIYLCVIKNVAIYLPVSLRSV